MNIEVDTESHPYMYIWVQISFIQPTLRPHPKQHREFDIYYSLVSPLWFEKLEELYHKTSQKSQKKTLKKPLGEDSWMLLNQIYATKIANILWA